MEKYFIVDQKSLLGFLAATQPICTKRTTLDATSSILIQAGHKEMVLKSTDLEISLQSSCALQESSLTQPETFLVSGKRIFDIVKELENPITFSLKNDQNLILQAGAVTVALNVKDSGDFPPFPERIENLMHLDAELLRKLLDSVAFLIPQNNTNPALNGLLLEISPQELIMTATDGHCLAQVRCPNYTLPSTRTWLLPRRAIIELKKILESCQDQTLFLGTCGNQLVFSGEHFNFFTRLLADPFPQYHAILDKTSFIPSTIDRSRLVKTLRRSACFLSGQFLATKFEFASEKVRVSINNKEIGALDEELPISGYDQDPLHIRFYSPYLLNGLQSFSDETITLYLKNSTRPIIFESSLSTMNMTYLVMPVAHTNPS